MCTEILRSDTGRCLTWNPDVDKECPNFYDSSSRFGEVGKEKIVLDLMRKHARSWLIKVALVGIIVTFALYFGWGERGREQGDYVAKVNGAEITPRDFSLVYNSELEKIRLRFKGGLPEGFLETLDLKKKVIQGLVNQQLLLQEAKRLGLFVTDEDLTNDIRTNPQFQRNGAFDEQLYGAYLREIKLTPASYEVLRRQELLEGQVVSLLIDGVKTDPDEIKKLWHFQHDKLILSVLTVKPDQQKEKRTVDPEELKTFFKKNEKKYEVPALLELQYVVFSWRDLQKEFSVSDEEALSYYQGHPKEFATPERIHASHILLKVPENASREKVEEIKKRAEQIRARIKGGEDFAKIAEKESQDEATANKGGDLGFFSRGTMSPDLERIAFKLDVGEISEPVLTRQGYVLIRVTEKKPEEQADFNSVKERITQKLVEEKARKKVADDADIFYEKVYRSEDLEGEAKKFGFEVKKAASVSRAVGLPDVGSDPKLMDEAFQLKTGEISRLKKSGDNYILMKLVQKDAEHIPGLDEVRSRVEKDFLEEQALIAAKKKAEAAIDALQKKPDDLDAVAQKLGVTWEKLDPLSRTASTVPKLGNSPEVAEMLTTVSAAAPLFPAPIPVPDGVAVVRLAGTEPASDEVFRKDAPEFEKWIVDVRQAEFLKGWLQVLEKRSEVIIREKNL